LSTCSRSGRLRAGHRGAPPGRRPAQFFTRQRAQVVTTANGQRRLLFSRRADSLGARRLRHQPRTPAVALPAWRHAGLYATAPEFLDAFPALPRAPIEEQERLEQLRRACGTGFGIAVLALGRATAARRPTRRGRGKGCAALLVWAARRAPSFTAGVSP